MSTKKPRILIVDDEPDALELIKFNMKESGYQVVTAPDGRKALETIKNERPDLVVLDLMLPEVDGLEVCKIIRRNAETSDLPIIMLTAKAAEIDRVLGLELGADDYMTKPFSPRELMLRIRNLLKRKAGGSEEKESLRCGTLHVDIPRHYVTVEDKAIDLTATEFNLLTVLMQRRGRVQTRERLLQDVWDYDALVDTRTVDTHIRRLREKLGEAAKYLDTVRGVGYRFSHES